MHPLPPPSPGDNNNSADNPGESSENQGAEHRVTFSLLMPQHHHQQQVFSSDDQEQGDQVVPDMIFDPELAPPQPKKPKPSAGGYGTSQLEENESSATPSGDNNRSAARESLIGAPFLMPESSATPSEYNNWSAGRSPSPEVLQHFVSGLQMPVDAAVSPSPSSPEPEEEYGRPLTPSLEEWTDQGQEDGAQDRDNRVIDSVLNARASTSSVQSRVGSQSADEGNLEETMAISM